jgi:hypothetical protein
MLGVNGQSFRPLGGRIDILGPFIWSSVVARTRSCDGFHWKSAQNLIEILENCEEDTDIYYTSMRGREYELYTESQNSQVKNNVRSILILFLYIKETVHKEYINYACYCNILRRLPANQPRLLLEICRRKNWLLHHNNAPSHTSFSPGKFWQRIYLLSPTHSTRLTWPPATFLFPWSTIKLKDYNFDTIEWSRQNHRQSWTPSQNTTSTRTEGTTLKMMDARWQQQFRELCVTVVFRDPAWRIVCCAGSQGMWIRLNYTNEY